MVLRICAIFGRLETFHFHSSLVCFEFWVLHLITILLVLEDFGFHVKDFATQKFGSVCMFVGSLLCTTVCPVIQAVEVQC